MSILWMGGEDVDFPNAAAVSVNTTSSTYRTGYSRCSISSGSDSNYCKSTLFRGGAVTSAWMTFYVDYSISSTHVEQVLAGFGSSTGGGSQINGLAVTCSAVDGAAALARVSTAGAVITISDFIAGPNIFPVGGGISRVDLQVINYGSSGTFNLYVNNVLELSYTGNLSISGITGFDSIIMSGGGQFAVNAQPMSEFLVSTDDSRAYLGVVTDFPTGNGTTQQWSNPAYTNFNPIVINDANSTFSNTNGQDEQVTIQDIPSGNFRIVGTKVAARAEIPPGSSVGHIGLGFYNSNNTTTAVGSSIPVGVAFTTYESYFDTDPTTGTAWGANLTGYQIDMRSET